MIPGKYLVTGAAGFVGTHLLDQIQSLPDIEIHAVYRHQKPRIQASNITFIQADLRTPGDCARIVQGVDYVFMFAGKLATAAVMKNDPMGPAIENTVMNAWMLDAAWKAGVKKFVWLSSTTGYPALDKPLIEEDFFLGEPPSTSYAIGQQARYIETLARIYASGARPMTTILLRPASIYGEFDDFDFATCHAFPALMRRVIERHTPIEIWGDGLTKRDLIHASDVVKASLLALEKIEGNEVFNIGSGKPLSVNKTLELLLKLDHFEEAKIIHNLSRTLGSINREFNCQKAERILGFKPHISIEAGIQRTLSWYRKTFY